MATITCSDEFAKMVTQYAAEKGLSFEDACDRIGTIAVQRLNALRKHAAKVKAAKEAAKAAAEQTPAEA